MKQRTISPRGSSGGGGRGSGQGRGGGRGRGRGPGKGIGNGRGIGGGRGMGRRTEQVRGRGYGEWRESRVEAFPDSVEQLHLQQHSDQHRPSVLKPESPDQNPQIYRAQADTGSVAAQIPVARALVPELRREQAPTPLGVVVTEVSRKTSNNASDGPTAVVAREECICCGICADVCPEGAITVLDMAEVDPQKCTGCGLCVDECPNNAVILLRLVKAL